MPAVNRIANLIPPERCPACEEARRVRAEADAYFSQATAEAEFAAKALEIVGHRERQVTERERDVRRRSWGAAAAFLAAAITFVAALMARVS